MCLRIGVQKKAEGIVLKLAGELTRKDAATLGESIRTHCRPGSRSVMLDLSEVSRVDSAGLGELVSAYTFVCAQGAAIRFVGMQERSRDLLQRTGLSKALSETSQVAPGDRSWLKRAMIPAAILFVGLLLLWLMLQR